MSDKGYLNNKRERGLAKILDRVFNFEKLLPNKKVLFGLINIRDFVEKHDYNIFLAIIRLIDDGILAGTMNIQAAAIFDKALTFLENGDVDGFNNYVAELLAGKIDIPLVQDDKVLFLSALNLLKNLTNMVISKVNDAISAAEAEAETYKTE